MIPVSVEVRTEKGKTTASMNEAGRMPAVVYGPKQAPIAISLSRSEFEAILRHGGESSLIELQGLEKPIQAMIHEIDRDPVTNGPRHADFYAVEKGAKIEVAIPLSFIGESMAVKAGANLVKVMHELEIEADAAHLPHEIEVDISVLAEVDDKIYVRDLIMPAGVTVRAEADDVVALAQAVVEESEEESTAVDMDSIEVESKGKSEDADAAE